MRKKIFLLILSVFACICGAFYFRTKHVVSTFEESYNKVEKIEFSPLYESFIDNSKYPRNIYLNDYINISDFEELEAKSDLIATVKVIERKQDYNIITTTVEITKLIKGDSHEVIQIYEPARLSQDHISLYLDGIHMIMDQDENYLVFLQDALPKGEEIYNFVNTCLGLYPIKDNLTIKKDYLDFEGDKISLEYKEDELKKFDLLSVEYKNIPTDNIEIDYAIKEYYAHINNYELFGKTAFSKYLNKDIEFKHIDEF